MKVYAQAFRGRRDGEAHREMQLAGTASAADAVVDGRTQDLAKIAGAEGDGLGPSVGVYGSGVPALLVDAGRRARAAGRIGRSASARGAETSVGRKSSGRS